MSTLSFFLAWLANPRRVGAIAPSSAALAEAITADLTAASAPVIELGPGTGVFTRSIIARGIPEHRLALIEYGTDFIDKLQCDFPRAHVHRMDATRLRHLELFDGERAGAVVSGIPLLLMPAKRVSALLDGAFEQLRPDGAFYQFTYGPGAPIPRLILDRLGLKATRIGGTLANFPPAAVYRLRRRPSRTLPARRPENHANPMPGNAAVYALRADFDPILRENADLFWGLRQAQANTITSVTTPSNTKPARKINSASASSRAHCVRERIETNDSTALARNARLSRPGIDVVR